MNIKIACVDYLNTLPLLQGLKKATLPYARILELNPKMCLAAFKKNEVDIALVPTGGLHKLEDYRIFGSTCIGSADYVHSVAVFSNQDIRILDKIWLDSHSTTSVNLLKILYHDYFQKEIEFEYVDVNNLRIKDNEGVLMIGDKAFAGYHAFSHVCDLGHVWYEHTQLPFVYACWVGKKDVPDEILVQVDQALITGMHNIESTIDQYESNSLGIDFRTYLTKHIQYNFGPMQKEGLDRFLMLQEKLISNMITL